MEKVEKIGTTVVKMWLTDIEENAYRQVENLASLPFVYHHIALMPDCHAGMGMPIGGVLPTKDVVIPNAVGVDIGCGMRAVKTNVRAAMIEEVFLRKIIMRGIRERTEALGGTVKFSSVKGEGFNTTIKIPKK